MVQSDLVVLEEEPVALEAQLAGTALGALVVFAAVSAAVQVVRVGPGMWELEFFSFPQ